MPYNKGDFTQQGVNGDVSALVRLNEKRVMKVVLSSDDESDNCDISGKVYDLLNGTSYDIGSGVSGNIEITENGENINVAPYATATVNVSGGTSYTELEFIDNTVDEVYESVLTVSEILTASASGTLGFMKTDTVLVGATDLPSDIPYVIGVIYENEDVPGTYDVMCYPTKFTGLNGKGEFWNPEKQPTDHITITYQK